MLMGRYYTPSTILDYYSALTEVFFEGRLFHEIAMKKFFLTVPTKHSSPDRFDHLYGKGGRGAWHDNYNANLFMIHPIKLSFLSNRRMRKQ
ncbi:hypothetical protein COOONC_16868 [Cooperia oncophora]